MEQTLLDMLSCDDNTMQSLPNTAPMKYLLVCGAGLSGIGKGVVISSIGSILQGAGYKITVVKIDPYLVSESK